MILDSKYFTEKNLELDFVALLAKKVIKITNFGSF